MANSGYAATFDVGSAGRSMQKTIDPSLATTWEYSWGPKQLICCRTDQLISMSLSNSAAVARYAALNLLGRRDLERASMPITSGLKRPYLWE